MKVKIETITPEIAREMLSKNGKNRSLSDRTVDYYQRQMEKGLWEINGESIKIGVNGRLLDGQHRLEAICRSGLKQDMLVIRGLADAAIKTVDTGRARTPGDHLRIEGYEGQTSILSAAARILMDFDFDNQEYKPSRVKFSPSEIISFIDNNPMVAKIPGLLPTNIQRYLPNSIAIALYYLFSAVDEEATVVLFEAVCSGIGLWEGHPVLALRSRLQVMNDDKKRGLEYRRQIIYYFSAAFRAIRKREKIHRLHYRPEFKIEIEGIKDAFINRFDRSVRR